MAAAIAVLLALACSSPAQAPAAAGTAEELARRGLIAYSAGQHAEAESALAEFLSGYGSNPQVKEVVPRVLPPLALSRVHLKKFDSALEAIRLFLKEHARSGPPETVEELRFWNGVCEAQEKEYTAAAATLTAFARDYPRSAKRAEALILAGSLLVVQEKYKEAAAHFAATRPQLTGADRGRAVLLELYALLQSGASDAALRLVMTEYARAGEMAQLVAFHTLILELGSTYLEAGEHRKAIACLQRVWTRERLLKHQRERLGALQAALDRNVQQRAAPHLLMQQRQMIGQIEKELKTFEALPQFDSALRFRLASAFLGMQRYREAALIMEAMLDEMPADAVVEQASVNLVQCWLQIERWPKAIAAAATFREKFPKSKELPLVLLMQGQAQQSEGLYAEAIKSFETLLKSHAKHELAPRALFLKGFAHLLAEDYSAALATFDSFPGSYPADDLAETAFYWRGMALSMAKEFAKARAVFEDYLAQHAEGKLIADATYRRAYCAHSLQEYDASIAELRQFLQRFPDSEYRSEALVLLGDALMAVGEIEEGIAAYAQIAPEETKFFEEGWFKIGKALRLQEKPDALREHMAKFRTEHPKSPRIVEALYWIGWVHRQQGAPEKAVEIYWEAIEEFGNDPEMRAVDDLFPALAKLYKGDQERIALRSRLRDLWEAADDADRKTLAMRALWAQAQLLTRSDAAAAQRLLLDAAKRANVQTDNPLLLADFADAHRASGNLLEAEQLYRDLLKWNPRAPQKDRAFAGLGLIAQAAGREKAALDYFERFTRETKGSPLLGDVMLAKAAIHRERDQLSAAKEALEALLAEKSVRGSDKARALYEIGELHMREKQPQLAVPYFQRIYIMHARWADYVGKAYLRSAEAFEQLEDPTAAVKTYQELAGREELRQLPETTTARERLAKLEPVP